MDTLQNPHSETCSPDSRRNVEGEMILEFADALNFVVANTWFKKNEGSLIIYEIIGKCRTVIDYILIRKSDRKLIRDVKVIWSVFQVTN